MVISPLPKLRLRTRSTGGRNARGRITSYHRGGAPSRPSHLLRTTYYEMLGMPYVFLKRTEDPSRRSPLFLVAYANGCLAHGLAPFGVQTLTTTCSSRTLFLPLLGGVFPLGLFPVGSPIHALQLSPSHPIAFVRSPAASATLLRHLPSSSLVRLPSGQLRLFSPSTLAALGSVSPSLPVTPLGRAGSARQLGRRPTVRGVAMNPVDHPHGGGQGKTSGGRPSVSPWGQLAKGKRTRRRPRPSLHHLL